MELSIVIPVYNSSKTLQRCVDSILALDSSEYEIILVDDGSKDDSGKICDDYAAIHSFIKVIHQKNAGISAARNAGLKIAAGKYIMHCDSDDWYNSEALSEFLSVVNDNSSLSFFGNNILINGTEEGKYKTSAVDVPDNIAFLTTRVSHDFFGYAVWNKIYSRELLVNNRILSIERDKVGNSDDWCEDLFLNLQYYALIKQANQTALPVYCLQTHNKSEEQLNKELGTRIVHMFNDFVALRQTEVYKKISDDDFSKVFVWHIKRTFYDYLKVHSLEDARKDIINHPFGKTALDSIKARLKDKQFFYDRYDKTTAEDYMNMLRYFVSGNMTEYKLRSAVLWKIKAKGR